MASDSNSANETFAASEDDLHEEGRKLAGCHDFGDPSYPNGLCALSGALDDSKTLSGLGRIKMRRQIVTSRLEGAERSQWGVVVRTLLGGGGQNAARNSHPLGGSFWSSREFRVPRQ